MQTNDCWKRAYELIHNGADGKAAEICQAEPCASSSPECQQFLGWYFVDCKDYDKAKHWFEILAEKGNVAALYGLATVHFKTCDYQNSFRLYHEAMNQGHARSYYWVGYMLRYGLGVEQNHNKARDCFRQSADLGYIVSKRALLDMDSREGGVFNKIAVFVKLILLTLKAVIISYKNEKDERLVEVPNPIQDRR